MSVTNFKFSEKAVCYIFPLSTNGKRSFYIFGFIKSNKKDSHLKKVETVLSVVDYVSHNKDKFGSF